MKRLLLLSLSVLLPAALFAIADIARQPSAFGRILPITVTYCGPSEIPDPNQEGEAFAEPFEYVPVMVTLDANDIPGFSYAEIGSSRFVFGVEYQNDEGTSYITEYPHEIVTDEDGAFWNRDGVSLIWVNIPRIRNGSVSFNLYYMYDVDVVPADVWSGAFESYAEIGNYLQVEFGEIHTWREPSPEFDRDVIGIDFWQAEEPDPAKGYYWDMLFHTIQGPSAYTVYTEFQDVVDYSLMTNLFYDTSFSATDVAVVYHGVVDMFADDFPGEGEDYGHTYALATNRFYRARVIAEAEIDGEADTAFLEFPDTLFTGELKIETLRDAVESYTEPIPAIVRISLPDGVTAPRDGFAIPICAYSMTEGAWSGQAFEAVSYATIPAGESSVIVKVAPLVCESFTGDAEVELFAYDCASITYASTTFTVFDKGSSDAPPVICRWIHGEESSPCLSLAEALSYASYGDIVSIVGNASGEKVELKPGVVIEVADGGTAPAKENLSVPDCYKLTWNGDTPVLTLDADEVRPAAGAVTAGGKSFTVTVENAHKGLLYGLAFAETLDGLNAAAPADWTRAAADGPLSVSVDPHGATSAFARLVVTDVPLSLQ